MHSDDVVEALDRVRERVVGDYTNPLEIVEWVPEYSFVYDVRSYFTLSEVIEKRFLGLIPYKKYRELVISSDEGKTVVRDPLVLEAVSMEFGTPLRVVS